MTESQWKWADLIVKTVGVAIITGAISLYGITVKRSQERLATAAAEAQQKRDRKERQMNALVEFASAQKKLDVDVGMQLFQAFVDKYLDVSVADNEQIKENIVLLRLIALNFQDVPINLKPLFEDLDDRLTQQIERQALRPERSETSTGGADTAGEGDITGNLRRDLREIAKEVANRQAFRLTFLEGDLADFDAVREGDVRYFKSVPFAVQINRIDEDTLEVEIRETELNEEFEPVVAEEGRRIGPFVISYFDMPILDNVKVNDSTRLSVLLKSVDGETATLRGVSFRSDLATDRFDVKEMSRDIITDILQEERRADTR